MDQERAKLQQRVSDDLPHLTDYYLELSSEKGDLTPKKWTGNLSCHRVI